MKTATKPKPQALPRPGEDAATDGAVLAQLAAMQRLSVNELKAKWEALFGTPAPNNARAFLELRIGYRIQELTYGGLTRETRRMLDLLADEVEGKIARKGMVGGCKKSRCPEHGSCASGTGSSIPSPCWRTDTNGRAGSTVPSPPSPRPSPARTGTDFGSSAWAARRGTGHEQAIRDPDAEALPLRHLHPQVLRGRPRHGVQLPRCPAGSLRGLCRQPEGGRLGRHPRAL